MSAWAGSNLLAHMPLAATTPCSLKRCLLSTCITPLLLVPAHCLATLATPPPQAALKRFRCRRYLDINSHAKSYTWKALVRRPDLTFEFEELDMNKVRLKLCAAVLGRHRQLQAGRYGRRPKGCIVELVLLLLLHPSYRRCGVSGVKYTAVC